MSTKERVSLNHYWHSLKECNTEYRRAVTAGELAKYMGIARNTAAKYLKKLKSMHTVHETTIIFRNGIKGKRYEALNGAMR